MIILYIYTVVKNQLSLLTISLVSVIVEKIIHIEINTAEAPKRSPTMNLRTVNTSIVIDELI